MVTGSRCAADKLDDMASLLDAAPPAAKCVRKLACRLPSVRSWTVAAHGRRSTWANAVSKREPRVSQAQRLAAAPSGRCEPVELAGDLVDVIVALHHEIGNEGIGTRYR
jgi:hypothetical protein